MPLTMLKAGEKKQVLKITGNDEIRRHLENLGFVEGGEVSVVTEIGGNMIVSVKGARIAINKAMANRIMV